MASVGVSPKVLAYSGVISGRPSWPRESSKSLLSSLSTVCCRKIAEVSVDEALEPKQA